MKLDVTKPIVERYSQDPRAFVGTLPNGNYVFARQIDVNKWSLPHNEFGVEPVKVDEIYENDSTAEKRAKVQAILEKHNRISDIYDIAQEIVDAIGKD